jgi:hypothetical protein
VASASADSKGFICTKTGRNQASYGTADSKGLSDVKGEFVPEKSVPQIGIIVNSKLKANKEKELAGTFGKS